MRHHHYAYPIIGAGVHLDQCARCKAFLDKKAFIERSDAHFGRPTNVCARCRRAEANRARQAILRARLTAMLTFTPMPCWDCGREECICQRVQS